jgi:hypothetical protein
MVQTFQELIELASKGNPRNVDQYTDEVFILKSTADSEDNFYTSTEKTKPGLIYSFGKAAAGQGETTQFMTDVVYGLIALLNCSRSTVIWA